VARLEPRSAEPPVTPRPALERVTDRRLPAAVVYPAGHVAGRRLPVLLDIDGGPGHQEVRADRAAWLERQWWADNGFAVVTVDNRGTPGVAPSFEKVVHRRLADVMVTDQADALGALSGKHPDLDLARVAVRGRRFGGWLAALAVLRRPEVFRCAVAQGPIVDWARCGTAYAERYLGHPADGPEIYAHHSLLELAAEPVVARSTVRPLLIVADPTDPEESAQADQLSTALAGTDRPHELLREADPARRLHAERDFLRRTV
jgi:dipeptidyl-peptidase-4